MKPSQNRCRHGVLPQGCKQCCLIEDSGTRMADLINLKVISFPWDTICHSWMAFNLDTGDTDGVLYDSKEAAIAHQTDPRWFCYFFMRMAMGGVKALDCQLYMNFYKLAKDARMYEPEAPQFIMSTRGYDVMTGRIDPRG